MKPRSRSWLIPLAAYGLGVSIFMFYFLVYPLRHESLPLGFDPAWYVWRAARLGTQGVGSGQIAARPGYSILSAQIGALTGLSELRLVVVLSLVLVPMLALAAGSFFALLDRSRWGWAIAVAAAGIILGPTHLVGENLSNTLNLALAVAGLVALTAAASSRPGDRGWALGGAVGLLVASGLAHWDFLVVVGCVLGLGFLLSVRQSRRDASDGVPVLWTEAGAIGAVGTATSAVMAALILGVLRAPVNTIESARDEVLYRRKFRTDLARTWPQALAGLLAPPMLRRPAEEATRAGAPTRRRAFAVRLLNAWVLVMAAGIVFGTLSLAVPPGRFLAMLVALPGAVGVAAALVWVAGRLGMARAALALMVALGALAVPAGLRWFRYPELMDRDLIVEARSGDAYLRTLPQRAQVVFVLSFEGSAGVYSPLLEERTIRIGLAPERSVDAHFFVGDAEDLLAGRRSPAPDARSEAVARPYWEDVAGLIANRPPVLILQSAAPDQFDAAEGLGATVIAPGVSLLEGPLPRGPLSPPEPLPGPPSVAWGLVWGASLLALLGAAGAGWTRVILGPAAEASIVACASPAAGAGALILGGMIAAESGVRLGGAGGAMTYVAVALGGLALAYRRSG
jgi:hypothetical protein